MPAVSADYGFFYETVAASQTAQVLGNTGATGDYLHRLTVSVTTSATSTVTLLDGATSYIIVPPVTPVGVYSIEINAKSVSGAWKITTGAGSSVLAVGVFA
jgi:predicted ATP-grasp superfamily ATP-dependent carboligase